MEDLKAEAERLGLAKSKKLTLLAVESCAAGALAAVGVPVALINK